VVVDPGAIELRRQDGTLVDARLSISLLSGKTVAVLTFAGPDVIAGSLADGSYTLTVRADRVHDRWGREADGGGDDPAGGNRAGGRRGGRLPRRGRGWGRRGGGGRPGRRRFPSAFRDRRGRRRLPVVLRLRGGRRRGRPRHRPVKPPLRQVLNW